MNTESNSNVHFYLGDKSNFLPISDNLSEVKSKWEKYISSQSYEFNNSNNNNLSIKNKTSKVDNSIEETNINPKNNLNNNNLNNSSETTNSNTSNCEVKLYFQIV